MSLDSFCLIACFKLFIYKCVVILAIMFLLNRKCCFSKKLLTQLYRTKATKASVTVRNQFIEYYVNDNGHTFIPSSQIKPISDATVPFVNAGMVQFKSILQGRSLPPTARAANSQKCARVGGKHNDLDTVGTDGYHHTFFEMLGNWSFGRCNKHEACQMAWNLLTGPYGLNPSRLYVTYFGGDSGMNLEPDLECREIWRELGVAADHILPFGVHENFWEMGLVGPCGPCTEIHVDHIADRSNAAERVNFGFPDLTELWNIVFIQFNRNQDGSLEPLEQSHVDTGMGFERLLALLNGCQSNYDTDLFRPLLQAIHTISGYSPYSGSFDKRDDTFKKDCAYRVLCDHSRLLTVALADGVVPHNEYKLRWVLRRALNIAQDVMKTDERLLLELSNYVADSLCSIYPEVGKRLKMVQGIISHEAEIYRSLKLDVPKGWLNLIKERPEMESLLQYGSNPTALSSAYKKICEDGSPDVSPEMAFHLYESHGMNADLISEMSKLLGKGFSVEMFENELEKARRKSKTSTAKEKTSENFVNDLVAAKIPITYDNLMYEYDRCGKEYTFPTVSAKVVGIVVEGKLQSEVAGSECGVLLDRTNFYHTAGGQISDIGEIIVMDGDNQCTLSVEEVNKFDGYVVHFGSLSGSLKIGDRVMTKIDTARRTACMRNHTLAHLINGEVQHLFNAPIQEKCVVQPSFLKMTYYLHGEELKAGDVVKLEKAVNSYIEDQLRVDRHTVTSWGIPTATLFLPNETYPVENIHIIDIRRGNKVVSREACCGTHLLNVEDVGKFCIVEVMKSKKTSICAVTGSEAEEAMTNSQKIQKQAAILLQNLLETEHAVHQKVDKQSSIKSTSQLKTCKLEISKTYKKYNNIKKFIQENNRRFSYLTFLRVDHTLQEALSKIHTLARQLTELEVRTIAKDSKFVVHRLALSKYLEKVSLNKYTRLVDIPIMLFSLHDKELKVRCSIPKDSVSENFNALLWMNEVMLHLMESDQDAVVSQWKHEGQTAAVQTRTVQYKNRISSPVRKERLRKAKAAAVQLAEHQIGQKQLVEGVF